MNRIAIIVFIIATHGLVQGSENPLRLKQILQMALHSNSEIAVQMANTQISQADMQRLGLIESPIIAFGALFPTNNHNAKISYNLSASFNLKDLIQEHARRRVGKSSHEKTKQEVLSHISGIITEVKKSYFEYQAANQLRFSWQQNLQAAQSAAELARAQRSAGNISALDEAQQIAFFEAAKLEFMRAESAVKQARITLASFIGIEPGNPDWTVAETLMNLPKQLPSLAKLKDQARANSPTLLAQRKRIEASAQKVALAKVSAMPEMKIGMNAEWDPEGNQGIGPFIQIGLPFLGPQDTTIKKERADFFADKLMLRAMEQNTTTNIEKLYEKIQLASKAITLYQTELIPLQETIMKESLKHYNYMLLGNYQLLAQRQTQIAMRKEFIHALLDYWNIYVELEHMIGESIEHLEYQS